MIVIAAAIVGAVFGGYVARARNGSGLDIAHYAAGYGIAFGVLGLVFTLVIQLVG